MRKIFIILILSGFTAQGQFLKLAYDPLNSSNVKAQNCLSVNPTDSGFTLLERHDFRSLSGISQNAVVHYDKNGNYLSHGKYPISVSNVTLASSFAKYLDNGNLIRSIKLNTGGSDTAVLEYWQSPDSMRWKKAGRQVHAFAFFELNDSVILSTSPRHGFKTIRRSNGTIIDSLSRTALEDSIDINLNFINPTDVVYATDIFKLDKQRILVFCGISTWDGQNSYYYEIAIEFNHQLDFLGFTLLNSHLYGRTFNAGKYFVKSPFGFDPADSTFYYNLEIYNKQKQLIDSISFKQEGVTDFNRPGIHQLYFAYYDDSIAYFINQMPETSTRNAIHRITCYDVKGDSILWQKAQDAFDDPLIHSPYGFRGGYVDTTKYSFYYAFATVRDYFFITEITLDGQVPGYLTHESEEKRPLSIYPNPTKEFLRIDSPGLELKQAIVMNMNGQILMNLQRPFPTDLINVSGLAKGNYVLITQFESGHEAINNFVKN